MGSVTTSQQFIWQLGEAPGVSAFVLAATAAGFRFGLLLMIAVSAGAFGRCRATACIRHIRWMRSKRDAPARPRLIGAKFAVPDDWCAAALDI